MSGTSEDNVRSDHIGAIILTTLMFWYEFDFIQTIITLFVHLQIYVIDSSDKKRLEETSVVS